MCSLFRRQRRWRHVAEALADMRCQGVGQRLARQLRLQHQDAEIRRASAGLPRGGRGGGPRAARTASRRSRPAPPGQGRGYRSARPRYRRCDSAGRLAPGRGSRRRPSRSRGRRPAPAAAGPAGAARSAVDVTQTSGPRHSSTTGQSGGWWPSESRVRSSSPAFRLRCSSPEGEHRTSTCTAGWVSAKRFRIARQVGQGVVVRRSPGGSCRTAAARGRWP